MMTKSLATRWDELVQSMQASASSVEYQPYPDLADHVHREAEKFTGLPIPETPEEWESRRRQATSTRKQWSIYLSNIRTGRPERNPFGKREPVRIAG